MFSLHVRGNSKNCDPIGLRLSQIKSCSQHRRTTSTQLRLALSLDESPSFHSMKLFTHSVRWQTLCPVLVMSCDHSALGSFCMSSVIAFRMIGSVHFPGRVPFTLTSPERRRRLRILKHRTGHHRHRHHLPILHPSQSVGVWILRDVTFGHPPHVTCLLPQFCTSHEAMRSHTYRTATHQYGFTTPQNSCTNLCSRVKGSTREQTTELRKAAPLPCVRLRAIKKSSQDFESYTLPSGSEL